MHLVRVHAPTDAAHDSAKVVPDEVAKTLAKAHGEAEQKKLPCPQCGAEVEAGWKFCDECGAIVAQVNQLVNPGGDIIGTGSLKPLPSTSSARLHSGATSSLVTARPSAATWVYHKDGGCIVSLVQSRTFEYLTLFVIFLNAIWLGVDTDLNNAKTLEDTPTIFRVVENVFCVYFTTEIILRFFAFRRTCDCIRDYWFLFDSGLVVLMVLETWIIDSVWIMSDDGGNPVSDLGVLRLLRLLRLSRLARLMRSVPELLTIVKGIFAATRSVGSVLLFLAILCYVFAIVFTGIYKADPNETYSEEEEELQVYFGNLGISMFTLFVHGTLLDDLADLVVAIRVDSTPMLLVFFLFILLSSFTVLNMLIGILCDVVHDTEAEEKQRMKVEKVKDTLTGEFLKIDTDGSGKVSQKEFQHMVKDEQVLSAIERQLGIDRSQLEELENLLFTDAHGSKELSFDDFLKHLIRLRPEEQAGPMDIQQFRKVMREQERSLMRSINMLSSQIQGIRDSLLTDPARADPVRGLGAGTGAHPSAAAGGTTAHMHGATRLLLPGELGAKASAGSTVDGRAADGLAAANAACSSSTAPPPLPAGHTSLLPVGPDVPMSETAKAAAAKLLADASDLEIVEELRRRMPNLNVGVPGVPH